MIKFIEEIRVKRKVECSVEDFVYNHLSEVLNYNDTDLDFYRKDQINNGYAILLFSLNKEECFIEDLEDKKSILRGLEEYISKGGKLGYA